MYIKWKSSFTNDSSQNSFKNESFVAFFQWEFKIKKIKLRNYDQLIAIGGSGKDDKDNLIVLKFTEPTGGTSESTGEERNGFDLKIMVLNKSILRVVPNADRNELYFRCEI